MENWVKEGMSRNQRPETKEYHSGSSHEEGMEQTVQSKGSKIRCYNPLFYFKTK